MATNPQLGIDFNANLDGLTSSLTKATAQVDAFGQKVGGSLAAANASVDKLSASFGALKGALSVGITGIALGFLESALTGTVEKMVTLGHEAVKSGNSVEQLSAIMGGLKGTGVGVEQVSSILQALTLRLKDTGNESKLVGEAYKVLGIQTHDANGNFRSSGDLLVEISKKLADYADSTNKTALLQALLGRGGAEAAVAIKALGEQSSLSAKLTTEQAEAAEKLTKQLAILSTQSEVFKRDIANSVVPALNDVIEKFNIARKAGESFGEALLHAAGVDKDPSLSIGEINDQIEKTKKLLAEMQALPSITRSVNNFVFGDEGDLQKKLAGLQTVRDFVLRGQKADDDRAQAAAEKRFDIDNGALLKTAPKLTDHTGKEGAQQDPTKKILDGQLAALEATLAEERQQYKAHDDFLKDYYDRGYVSIQDYYAERNRVLTEGQAKAAQVYDQEEKDARAAIASAQAVNKSADVEGFQNKIIEINKRRMISSQEASRAGIDNANAETKANLALGDQLTKINSDYDAITHHSGDNSLLGFLNQNRDLLNKLDTEGKQNAIAKLLAIGNQAQAQKQLNDVTAKAGNIEQDLSNKEALTAVLVQNGQVSELQGLSKIGDARQTAIGLLQQQYDAFKKIADGSADPFDVTKAEAMRVKLEQLKASADALGNHFRDIVGNSIVDSFQKIAAGTGTVADAFKSLATAIINDLIRINLTMANNALFKSIAANGGFGNVLSNFFGGSSSAQIAATNTSNSLGAIGVAQFAGGGRPDVGVPSLVGEMGPELFVPDSAGIVIPSSKLGGGGHTVQIVQNISIDSRTDKADILQAMASAKNLAKAEIMRDIKNGGVFSRR